MLLLVLLASAPIRLTVEGGPVEVPGTDGGTLLPRRSGYVFRYGAEELRVDGLGSSIAVLVHADDGGLRAEVSEPAPKGVELVRELSRDDAPRYRLVNATSRAFVPHLPTLFVQPLDGGEPVVRECVIMGELAPRATLALGQWDEACFAAQRGMYRSIVYLADADPDAGVVRRVYQATTKFLLTPGSHRGVFQPKPGGRVYRQREMVFGPGGTTACVCEGTRIGLEGPLDGESPVGDFPEPFMQK